MACHCKIITHGCASLLLGVTINVAVAWACAVWVDPSGRDGYGATQIISTNPRVVVHVLGSPRTPSGQSMVVFTSDMEKVQYEEPVLDLAPSWTGLRGRWDEMATGNTLWKPVLFDARGWPMLALFSINGEGAAGSWLDRGIRVPSEPRQVAVSNFPRCLPLRPIWPGFAVNSLLYAMAFWLLIAAPLALWRRSRIKRAQLSTG